MKIVYSLQKHIYNPQDSLLLHYYPYNDIMKKSLVYTKTGDKGRTSLVGGKRVSKTHVRLESYGTVDELNSHIGVLITYVSDQQDIDFLTKVQNKLFVIGGYLATDQTTTKLLCSITDEDVKEVEQQIDNIDSCLPELKFFVLPGGCRGAAICHVCRTVCRRAERRILSLSQKAEVSDKLIAYVNRLSDYLFVLSRKLNVENNSPEIKWINDCK